MRGRDAHWQRKVAQRHAADSCLRRSYSSLPRFLSHFDKRTFRAGFPPRGYLDSVSPWLSQSERSDADTKTMASSRWPSWREVVCFAKKQPRAGPSCPQMELTMKKPSKRMREPGGVVCSSVVPRNKQLAKAASSRHQLYRRHEAPISFPSGDN